MQNNFEPTSLKYANKILSKDLYIAKQWRLHNYEEPQKELSKEDSLWKKIINLFNKYF